MKLVGWTSVWAALMVSMAFAQVGVVVDEPDPSAKKEKVKVPSDVPETPTGGRRYGRTTPTSPTRTGSTLTSTCGCAPAMKTWSRRRRPASSVSQLAEAGRTRCTWPSTASWTGMP
jgi:hypothetical protein